MLLQTSGLQGPVPLPREPLLGGRGEGQTSCMLSEDLYGYFVWAHTPLTEAALC